MGRTKKFIKNTMATGLLQVITMLSGFILPKVMLTVYGSEINGLVTSITQLIAYFTVVEAGLSGSIIYSLYKPIADNDNNRINRIMVAAKNYYYRIGYLFLGLVIGAAFIYPLFISTNVLKYYEIGFLFIVLGFNGVLEFFTLAKYRALLTADQKTYVISLASIIQVILNVLIISVLSYFRVAILLGGLISILIIIIRTIILWIYCRKNYRFLDFTVEPDNTSLDKRWDALYLQVIGVIHNGAPVVITTFLLTLNDVSIYSIYFMVINGINSVLSIFTSGLSASFGDILVRDEKENFKKAFQQFEYVFYLLITIVYSITMITYMPFIKVYTSGADIDYIFPALAILMTINGYFYNLKTPFGMLTISAGKYKESRVQITVQGILEIICSIIFALFWGLNGIIIGSIISNLYRDIDFIFFTPKHLTHYSFQSSLIMWIRSMAIFILNMIILSFIPNAFVSDYISWLGYALIVGLISTFITLGINIIFDFNLFKDVSERIKVIFKRTATN